MRPRYKIIELFVARGDRWPKYGIWEHISYRKDLEYTLRTYCQTSEGPYFASAEKFKEERTNLDAGEPVEDDYVCIVLDEEPERNEFGVVSP